MWQVQGVSDASDNTGYRAGAQAVPSGASLGCGAEDTTGGEGADTACQEVDIERGSTVLFEIDWQRCGRHLFMSTVPWRRWGPPRIRMWQAITSTTQL